MKNILMKVALLGAVLYSLNSHAQTQKWERHNVMSSPASNQEVTVESWKAGKWQYSGMSGYLNVIYTQNKQSASTEAEAQRIYLQWVRTDQPNQELVYSIALKEFSSVPNYIFSTPKCIEKDQNCTAFSITGTHIYDAYNASFSVHIGGLGQYFIRF